MDSRLEQIDILLAKTDVTDFEREVHFALAAIDLADPNTMRWAAAMLAAWADEIEGS